MTFGEDSSICCWSLENGAKMSWKRSMHEGAPIWSADVALDKKQLFTGDFLCQIKITMLTLKQ
jgi:hypothetical protein